MPCPKLLKCRRQLNSQYSAAIVVHYVAVILSHANHLTGPFLKKEDYRAEWLMCVQQGA